MSQSSDLATHNLPNKHKNKYDWCTAALKHIVKLSEKSGSKSISEAQSGLIISLFVKKYLNVYL